MEKEQQAVSDFGNGCNCCQAVLAAFAPESGLARPQALQIATAFGGGMAYLGEVCGAVTGAFMAMGLAAGASVPGDEAAKARVREMALAFYRRFREVHDSIHCRQLIGYDLLDPAGLEQAKLSGIFEKKCTRLVETAVTITAELLDLSAGGKTGMTHRVE